MDISEKTFYSPTRDLECNSLYVCNWKGLDVVKIITMKRNTTPVDENESGIIEKVFSRNARGTIHAVRYLLDDQTTIYEK